jgi:hypothetical protein
MQAKTFWSVALALGLCVPAASALAETLYKLIDKNGKVTYAEKPPKDFDGKVIRLDIDPNANTATLPKPPAKGEGARQETENEKIIRRQAPNNDERIREAKAKLEAAQQALAAAQSSDSDADFMIVRNAGGGVRRVPTEEHAMRLAALEKAVKDAEQELAGAERGPPL